ncbi:MAG TPA: AAA family ATPase, partial [Thermoanaerobaculia bacterium]|nr:AAA family ATPase [Thermoanaerobaculia bacterium]
MRERIRSGGGGVTLLSAPAGSGKSTLLADWVARAECAVAWLSLEPADADVPRLLTYVVAALRSAGAIAADAIPDDLLGSAAARDAALTAIANAVAERRAAAALVLDDFHTIERDDAHAAVQFLLDHLPPNLHLVIASRVDPPLALARLRARGQLAEIRAADLRFTAEETRAFLHDAMALPLPDAEVEELEKKTEGWAAGLQLAALSLRGHGSAAGSVAALRGTNRYILDYLTEEVLASQPAELRDFLLESSVLDRLCGPLCDRVLQRTGSDEILQQLDAANLFLIPLDDVRTWYRYHHLFADVLQHRLRKQSGEARIAELHCRASDWYLDNGLPEEALQHALLANDAERAATIVSRYAFSLTLNGQSALVVRWIGLLPQDRLRDSIELLLTHGVALAAEYKFEEAEQVLQRGQELLGTDEQSEHYAAYLVARGTLAIMTEMLTAGAAGELLTRALALLPPTGFWRSLASFHLGMDAFMRNELRRSEGMFEVVRRAPGDERGSLTTILAQAFSGFSHLLRGETSVAEELAREGIAWTEPEDAPHSPLAAVPYALLADVHLARHELEQAHNAAQRALGHGRHTMLCSFEAARVCAGTAEAMHEWDAATRTLTDASRAIRYSANARWQQFLDILLHRTILRRA